MKTNNGIFNTLRRMKLAGEEEADRECRASRIGDGQEMVYTIPEAFKNIPGQPQEHLQRWKF